MHKVQVQFKRGGTTLYRHSIEGIALFRHLRDQLSPGSPGLKAKCPT